MIRVILSDPLVTIGKTDVYMSIVRQLQGFFDKVAQKLTPKERIQVSFPPGGFQATDRDVIVYFTSTDYSVVSRLTGKAVDPLASRHWGLTASEPPKGPAGNAHLKRASEVYTRILNAEVLARLAFHEAMHNKMRAGNELHDQGGLARGNVGSETPLTDANVTAMAAAMATKVQQWPEGFDFLLKARQRRDGGDPMWYS